MRRFKQSSRRSQRGTPQGNRWLPFWSWDPRVEADRRGTVLIVVLALLGLLALLGVTFYTFANQEENNAEYHANASKVYRDDDVSADIYFDWSLKQLIMGAPKDLRNSQLYGGSQSLMANLVGYDIQVQTGPGVKLMLDGTTFVPKVDMNDNGQPDDGSGTDSDLSYLGNLSRYPGAPQQGVGLGQGASLSPSGSVYYPAPDVDYTYPDINNPFLAFKGYVLDSQKRPVFVVIPSFHRPQYLRSSGGVPIRDSSINNNTVSKVMRPHQDHVFVNPDGTLVGTTRRFIDQSEVASFPATAITSGFPFDITDQGVWNMRRWMPGNYEIGDWVIPNSPNGYYYRCTTAGTAGGSEPSWPTSGTVGDGSVEWTAFAQPTYQFDADPDGDGVNEAIYVDLDFPIQELGDGRRFIPLFAMTVLDADGLINLSTSGNMNGNLNLGTVAQRFGFDASNNAAFISRSNLGMTRSEINPQFGLSASGNDSAYPTGTFDQLSWFYNRTVSGATPWVELSNMEWWWLNVGRLGFTNPTTINDMFEGRYGELNRLQPGWSSKNALNFSWPGVSRQDDSFQWPGGTGGNLTYGQAANGHPFTWPLDFRGTGRAYNNKLPLTYTGTAPFRWPAFLNFSSAAQQSIGWRPGVDGLMTSPLNDNAAVALQNILMNTPDQNAGTDDPAELNADPKLTGRSGDNNFGPSHAMFLQASAADLVGGTIHSILGDLAPFNFKTSVRASDIRQRFTPISYDLRTRSHEFDLFFNKRNAETQSSGSVYEFPPQFGTGAGYYAGDGTGQDADPFRPELRSLLRQRFGERGQDPSAIQQRKLSLNHVLDRNQPAGNFLLVNRELTEHPADAGTAPVTDPGTYPTPLTPAAYSGNTARQEFYARRDRQLLARDIFTLLYFFCGGQDNVSPFNTSNSSFTVHTQAQLQEMAQFACNYVNALDRDHVIDRFEYDLNLHNGWDVDDNPFTTSDGGTERAAVDGVETQLLSLSEVLAVHAPKVEDMLTMAPEDHDATEWDDQEDRYFSYIELRNPGPFPVTFNNGAWRIEVEPTAGGAIPDTIRRLVLKQGTVGSGGLFTILSAGDAENTDSSSNVRPSYMMVAPEYDMADMSTHTHRQIIPFAPPNASEKLDLITEWDMSNAKFAVTNSGNADLDAMMQPYRLLNAANVPLPNQDIKIKLQRRMSLTRTTPAVTTGETDPQNLDNPWVTVDEMTLSGGMERFALQPNSDMNDIPGRLDNLTARFRDEPFSTPNFLTYTSTNAPTYQANTIGGTNTPVTGARVPTAGAPPTWDHYQVHFNRPLTSPIELFSIPMYAPVDVLDNTHWRGQQTAGVQKFLRPNSGTGMAINDNRWYRLLSFVEVMDWGLSDGHFRTAGKINWNTIRHPEVWAGLLDESIAFNQFWPLIPANKQQQYLADYGGDTERDWWWQFIISRDGYDPQTDLLLPGMPNSRPFHSFNHLNGNNGIEATMLRQLPDANAGDNLSTNEPVRRRLLELRNRSEFNDSSANNNPGTNSKIDHYTRHRLLSKVLNNSTTRSNTFFVFIQVDYFEAVVDTNGATRIGGKLAESPAHRGFFVLDRTLGLEELRAADFKTASDPDFYTLKDTFDFRSVIVHRQLLD